MNEQILNKAQIIELMTHAFNETPYHQHIGLSFSTSEDDNDVTQVHAHFSKQDEILGNVKRNMVHGGVISGVFDALGGVACSVALIDKYHHLPTKEGIRKLNRICTVGLKMDFISPAKGEKFIATSEIVNMGSSIILVEMRMKDNTDNLIATASANYMY